MTPTVKNELDLKLAMIFFLIQGRNIKLFKRGNENWLIRIKISWHGLTK